MIDVTEHMGLVKKIISKHYIKALASYEFDDLFQTGCIGLLKAARDYEEGKGAFSTYAYFKIRGEISIMIRDDKFVPNPYRDKLQNTIDSLDKEISSNGKPVTVLELLDTGVAFESETVKKIMLSEALKKLDNESRTIIKEYYFLDLKQSEIAERRNQTQVNISRIIRNGRNTMKRYCEV